MVDSRPFLCPMCKAHMMLTMDEQLGRIFTCVDCQEEIEILY